MRAIEKRMVAAVNSKHNLNESNTQVMQANGNTYVYLFENCIYKIINGKRFFTLCGWNTTTTRSRLAALGVNVTTKNGTPFWNGNPISSNVWYKVA